MDLNIPVLNGPVFTGEEFFSTIDKVVGQLREDAILAEFQRGNVPEFMRHLVEVTLTGGGHEVSIFVTPDVLCVGTNDAPGRTPMYPKTAESIAEAFDAVLPTPKMSDAIYEAAGVKLVPHNLPPDAAMTSTADYLQHNRLIEQQLSGVDRSKLVAGHKKDIVITSALKYHPGHVAIYGWHRPDGTPIQGLNVTSHSADYVDYSHGVRLISIFAKLDGQQVSLPDLLKDPELSKILSHDGPVDPPRYPV